MYNTALSGPDTVDRVAYKANGYQRISMTSLDGQPDTVVARAIGQTDLTNSRDVGNPENAKDRQESLWVTLAPSIYSAGTLKCSYFGAVFATFVSQSFILYLFVSEDGLRFFSGIGYEGGISDLDVLKRALGRFICFLLILLKGQEDMQNALDLMFTRFKMGIICSILQIMVALFLPVAFIFSLSDSMNFLDDIIKTGLLRIFIEIDTQVLKLAMMGQQSNQEDFRNLRTVCVCKNTRTVVRFLVLPLYMLGFFVITWFATMQQYPFAFVFFAFTIGIYMTPYHK